MHTMVIRVEEGAGHYTARLFVDDGTQSAWDLRPVAEHAFPADDPRLAAAVARHAAARTDYGPDLYSMLAGSGIGDRWLTAFNGRPHRTVFDVRPDVLRALRWELMADGNGRLLFTRDHPTCLRGKYSRRARPALELPIKVLVVVGDPQLQPTDADPLGTEDEIDEIWEAIGGHPGEWHVDVLRGPTKQEFAELAGAMKPNVLHFIGHSARPDGITSALMVNPPQAKGWSLDKAAFGDLQEMPDLVILNACRTADAVDPNTIQQGLAASLEDLGVHCLITMQADITKTAARVFTREFYQGIADRRPIDAAVSRARAALRRDARTAAEWAVPSLVVNGDPESLCWPPPERPVIDLFKPETVRLVDRAVEHRMLWDDHEPHRLNTRLTMIADAKAIRREPGSPGSRQVGKSMLLRSCLHGWQLRGKRVCYVDLDQRGTLLWLDVLRAIRDGLVHCLPEASQPAKLFNHKLMHYRSGQVDALPEGPLVDDDGALWKPDHWNEPELRDFTFAAMRTLLTEVAGDEPLVLAIDNFSGVAEKDLMEELTPKLFRPIATGELPQVAMIVSGRGEQLDLLDGWLPGGVHWVPVDRFPRSAGLLRQYGVLRRADYTDEKREKFVEKWRQMILLLVDEQQRISAGEVESMVGIICRGL